MFSIYDCNFTILHWLQLQLQCKLIILFKKLKNRVFYYQIVWKNDKKSVIIELTIKEFLVVDIVKLGN